MSHPQLDIRLDTQRSLIPRYLPGVLTAEDFVFFIFPECDDFDFSRYTVVIEVLDTAGPPYRSICILSRSVEIPRIALGPYARIGLVPDSNDLPVYEAELNRGSTYHVPHYKNFPGLERIQMTRHGIWRPNGL